MGRVELRMPRPRPERQARLGARRAGRRRAAGHRLQAMLQVILHKDLEAWLAPPIRLLTHPLASPLPDHRVAFAVTQGFPKKRTSACPWIGAGGGANIFASPGPAIGHTSSPTSPAFDFSASRTSAPPARKSGGSSKKRPRRHHIIVSAPRRSLRQWDVPHQSS
jgi:hypothetical protein